MGFSLRVNHKKIALGSKKKSQDQENRNRQFMYIGELRESSVQKGYPSISVDTKKKEFIGNFKNSGSAYSRVPRLVNDHDFPCYSEGKGIPYGIYDTQANKGTVFIGTTFDTADFAVESIEKWWRKGWAKTVSRK